MKLYNYLLCGILVLSTSGCAVIVEEDVPPPPEVQAENLANGIKCGQNILTAIQNNDYAAMKQNLTESLQQNMTPAQFAAANQQMTEEFGKIVSFNYLADLETPEVNNMVWVVTFERQNDVKQTIRRQLLFRLVTANMNGKTEVFSFGFF